MKKITMIAAASAAVFMMGGVAIGAAPTPAEKCVAEGGVFDAVGPTCTITSFQWVGDPYTAGRSGNLVQDYTSSTVVYSLNRGGQFPIGDTESQFAEVLASGSGSELCEHHTKGPTGNCE